MSIPRSAKTWLLVNYVVLLVFTCQNCVHGGKPIVPCYFIFGDSLSDSGNNNNLPTLAKANYLPYGIDFPGGPFPPRFTNARTTVDFIGEFLGFTDYTPTFASTRGTHMHIVKGVNYASGSSGIRDESGQQLGARVSFNGQISNHKTTVNRLALMLGGMNSTLSYLNQCLYSINIGSNDYISNYFMPQLYPSSTLYTPAQYATLLAQQYSHQLQTLYRLGARKMVLSGIGLIGCTPGAIATFGTNGSICAENLNNASGLFNNRIVSIVDELNANLIGANLVYVNVTGISILNASAAGFTVTNQSCCPVSSDGQCVNSSVPCQNRNEYVFYDAFHPTEAFNLIYATRSYNASLPFDTYPTDIQTLAQM